MVNVLGTKCESITGSLSILRVHQEGTLDISGETKTAVFVFIYFYKSVYI